MSKVTNLPGTEPRIKKVDVKKYSIAGYDVDNAYPQRIMELINASSTAKQAVGIYADFIAGEGFADLNLYKLKVNSRGLTADDLLNRVASDFAPFKGFAIHVNWNAAFEIDSLYYTPFENVRKGIEDYAGRYAVHSDWRGKVKKEEIEYVYPFNPDPAVIQAQVDAEGGWDKYNGQLYYFSADYEAYPLASCDAVIEPMKAEIASDKTTTSNLENNFALKNIYVNKGEFQTEEERREFIEGLKAFMGPEGEQVMVAECETTENTPEVLKIESALNDKLFAYTDDKVLKKIIRHYKQPGILHSITDGGYFNQQQLQDAMNYYNGITRKDRILMERVFEELFLLFKEQVTDDFQIKPLTYNKYMSDFGPEYFQYLTRNEIRASINQPEIEDTDADKKLLVEILGVGGTQALQSILVDPSLSSDQKINTLKIIFGISDDDARSMVLGNETN
ncbi:hypothetical protein [Pedobacter sp. SYSU D00535]|uniref:hypothetical protein n=1 Tax=Pedobacter sp. SYSU D00535 TaxID=2810308 RepID=UPI001A964556|nr:hypothetical protein [Pedobacter sp. SYSU D00535]